MKACEEYGAGYVIARAKDEDDRTISIHLHVADPEDAAELDALLLDWEAKREESMT